MTAAIEAHPNTVLFIDDSAGNIQAAREAGLHGIHWHLSEGHDVLRSQFAEHGVHVLVAAIAWPHMFHVKRGR